MQNIRRKQAAQRKRIRQKKDETAARQSARTAEEQVQHELFGEDPDAGQLAAQKFCFSVYDAELHAADTCTSFPSLNCMLRLLLASPGLSSHAYMHVPPCCALLHGCVISEVFMLLSRCDCWPDAASRNSLL